MPDLIFSLAKILVVGLFTTQTGIAEVVDWSVDKAIAYRQAKSQAPEENSSGSMSRSRATRLSSPITSGAPHSGLRQTVYFA
jgi:hypothetical protein